MVMPFANGERELVADPQKRPLIRLTSRPPQLETPFRVFNEGLYTPNDAFFVRNHFPTPEIDGAAWRLKVGGAIEKPVELSLAALRKMEAHTMPALLECAGNGRVFLMPKKKGAQWQLGGVGNAEWTGVLLSDVLKQAGLKKEAAEIVLEGTDTGLPDDESHPAGPIHFARSLPLRKAMKDVLLAFQMNGKDLSPNHGYPVRAIVPGWYGVASVKWLSRIIVTDQPFKGYFQTVQYSVWERPEGEPVQVPITALPVKAEIARPVVAEAIQAGTAYLVRGSAWCSDAEIEKVEISFDWGATWELTRLLGQPVRNAWQLWEYAWKVPAKAGKATLMVRATDSQGRAQPDERNQDSQ